MSNSNSSAMDNIFRSVPESKGNAVGVDRTVDENVLEVGWKVRDRFSKPTRK